MADINQDNIHSRLRRPHHVLSWRDKLDGGVVELVACPAVTRLVAHLVPVEELGNLVRHVAQTTAPPIPSTISLAQLSLHHIAISTHRFPPSINCTKGLIYALHLLHLAIIVSATTGTMDSPSFRLLYGVITKPSGILDLPSKLAVVGIAFKVQRSTPGSALAWVAF